MLSGAAAAVAASWVPTGAAHAQGTGYQDGFNQLATADSTHSIPFYGEHQAGIATPPQTAAAFLSFEVTAGSRRELTDLFRTLTERAAFLTEGGTPPPPRPGEPPEHRHLLGSTVLPDDLTVTVAVGASLFDRRYGLAPRKPAQLKTMRAFSDDDLDPKITHGDLLVQLCANHRDTVGNAMLDIMRQTSGGVRLRWRVDGFRFPPRPVGIPRDWMGFKDGISNPHPTDASQMNQVVWVQPGRPEPAWTAGGTYQALRIIRMHLDKWDEVPVEQQERIFGRRKISGAPLYATDPNASDELDPIYTNDPQGRLTPLDCHIRLANPRPRRPQPPAPSCAGATSTTEAPTRAGTPTWGTRSAASSKSWTPTWRCRPGSRRRCSPASSPPSAAATSSPFPAYGAHGTTTPQGCWRAEAMSPASAAHARRLRARIPRSAVAAGVGILLAPIGSLACGSSPSAEKPAAPVRIYVTNQLDNTASVIDGTTHKTVATVPVGVSPAQMAVAPDRTSVYVANTGSNFRVGPQDRGQHHRSGPSRCLRRQPARRCGRQPRWAIPVHGRRRLRSHLGHRHADHAHRGEGAGRQPAAESGGRT